MYVHVGDLQEVDGCHFHVFEIPEDCTSLSDVTDLVMPAYDPESGYVYVQYVEGERVHPNQQILLLDKVNACMYTVSVGHLT